MPGSMPDRIAINARLPHGEEGLWSIIRTIDRNGPWSVATVLMSTNTHRTSVSHYVGKLVSAGIARCAYSQKQGFRPVLYRLVKHPAHAPRLRRDGSIITSSRRECLWRAIRTLKAGFTVRDLAFHASLPDQPITETYARHYIELLAGAGYLQLISEREGRAGLRTWRLKASMNTGPLSPTSYRVTAVYDRNLRKAIGEAVAREVAP